MSGDFFHSVIEQLTGETALLRERGVLALNRLLKSAEYDQSMKERLQAKSQNLITSDQWTQRLAAVNIAKALVSAEKLQGPATSDTEQEDGNAFTQKALESYLRLLEDSEPRVRLAVGEYLGLLAEKHGITVWEAAKGAVVGSIESSWDRDAEASLAEQEAMDSPRAPGGGSGGSFLNDLLSTSYTVQAPGTGDMRHGTEGWRCLETSFKALQGIMEGCGAAFQAEATPQLRALIFHALLHPNRFVRETGYHMAAALCALAAGPRLDEFSEDVACRLQDGLSENWSQVRYAACVAARAFMLALGDRRSEFYPRLLPHLCFNRHDVAEGVRSYSQDTWRLVMGSEGPSWVAKCMPQVVEYYGRCAKTNNHTVREAACTCISELASKIDADAVRPHLPTMLRTLITCLRDDSWPVRDAALLAAGKCAAAFPAECGPSLPELLRLWIAHLDDNIFSVREDAGIALGDAVRACRQQALDRLLPWLRESLPKAKEQPPDADAADSSPGSGSGAAMSAADPPGSASGWPGGRSGGATGGSKGTSPRESGGSPGATAAPSGGPRRIPADIRPPEHGGLFHGGALAGRKKDTGGVDYSCGCMDYGFRRPKEPWEASDGAVYLLRELAQVAPETVPEFLPVLAEVARLDHFSHCRNLQETIWKQLPSIAAGLGKRVFKRHMDDLLAPLFGSLGCEHQLCRAAAGRCIGQLRDFVGPGIWAGHLTDDQAAAMARSPDIPAPAGAFSRVGRPGSSLPAPTAAPGAMAPTRAPWASDSIPPLQRQAVKPGYGIQFPGR